VVPWFWLGRAAYGRVLADQLALRSRVWNGDEGAVLLCEHPPTITLGRSATEANIVDAGDVPVVRIERGGEVTYHGPGQLMVYAIVRLRSVVQFLERVAGAIIAACEAAGVTGAEWRRDPAGVWRGEAKLAACGIHVSRGVPVHGFALDVATPPDAWRRIRPCGLDRPTVSIERARGDRDITVERMAIETGPRVAAALAVR
jgi:lipoyl(octanoyl) transferase